MTVLYTYFYLFITLYIKQFVLVTFFKIKNAKLKKWTMMIKIGHLIDLIYAKFTIFSHILFHLKAVQKCVSFYEYER
jgi:hypothetical protein